MGSTPLCLPAVRTDSNGSYLYVKDGDAIKKSYIKTGITTDKAVEVLSGVSEGDQIVVSGTVSQEKTAAPTTKDTRRGPGF